MFKCCRKNLYALFKNMKSINPGINFCIQYSYGIIDNWISILYYLIILTSQNKKGYEHMPKVGMEPIRRAEVINATLECICERGIEGVTLDLVAAKAGFSKGIVSYYFKSKKQLLSESFKAFLSYYQKKIGSSITKEMSGRQMLEVVVHHALPPIYGQEVENQGKINVSELYGIDKMEMSPGKKAQLFIQFFSMAGVDDDFKSIVKEIYAKDIAGIANIFQHASSGKEAAIDKLTQQAYGLLAMFVGLSFFRVADFYPQAKKDNREVCIDYVESLLKGGQ